MASSLSEEKANMIITISRELGKRLAEALHIPCYDNEIIAMIPDEQGPAPDYVARVLEGSLRAEMERRMRQIDKNRAQKHELTASIPLGSERRV